MQMRIAINSTWGEEKKVLNELDKLFSCYAFSKEDCQDLLTSVAEACLNAMEHGNKLIPHKQVEVFVSIIGNTVTVDVLDQGSGFNTLTTGKDSSSPTQDRGWGMLLIRNLVDNWSFYHKEDKRAFGISMKKTMTIKEVALEDGKGTIA